MLLRGLIDEDFVNYKIPSMFLITPFCTFKCDKESGCAVCQNSSIVKQPIIEVSNESLIKRYEANPISKAIVVGGLEPFDSTDLETFIRDFRAKHSDTLVIYSGYEKTEVVEKFRWIYDFHNMVIKYGRFVPNAKHRFDEILGIELQSDNQFAEKYE